MKCKACDRLLSDQESIELCRECLKADTNAGLDVNNSDIQEDDTLTEQLELITDTNLEGYLTID